MVGKGYIALGLAGRFRLIPRADDFNMRVKTPILHVSVSWLAMTAQEPASLRNAGSRD